MSLTRHPHSKLSGTEAFTLIEMLVAMLIAGIVLAALSIIFVVSLHQQSLTSDKIQSDQLGRTLMTNIVDDLHSSCTGLGTSPVQAPEGTLTSPLESSGPTNLWFISSYGSSESGKAVIEKVNLHDIHWTETGTSSTTPKLKLGKLIDYSFPSTSGSTAPNWTFPTLKESNATTRVIGTNVAAPSVSGIPLFRYYSYVNNTKELTNGELNTTPLSTPLTIGTPESSGVAAKKGTAEEAAQVSITFTQAPTDNDTRNGRTSTFTDSVVLRFSPTTTGTGIESSPCE